MSPGSSRAKARRQRSLFVSLAVVVVIAVGWLAAVIGAGWSPKLGLDLAGGFSVVYQPAHQVSASDLNTAVNILNNRVNGLGVSGATVNTQNNQIVVQVPGVKNAQQVLNSIGQTAQLFFRPAICGAPAFVGAGKHGAQPATAPLPTCPAGSTLSAANLNVQVNSNAQNGFTANNVPPAAALAAYPSTPSTNDNPAKTVLLPANKNAGSYVRYLLGPAPLTGKDVTKALAQQDQAGAWVVNMNLNGAGSAAWDKMAQTYFHQIIGIELDGQVVSAPITQPTQGSFTSFNGQVQISGGFTQQQAQDLANDLTYGALPVKLEKLTTQTVSPTLGRAALDAGLGAGIAGLALVLLYVLLYYRLLGVVIISGLGITGALLWAIISSLGHTSLAPSFDLAGVTGVIVSIGITVDSYIVYFERLKDETRSGRSVRTSVDRGFKSAWRTVLAADFISLAAAVVLYLFAVAQVRGFAFFLGLSTILDIFITYFFTRPLVIILGRNERLVRARGFGMSRGLAITEEPAANGHSGRNGARRPLVAGGRRADS